MHTRSLLATTVAATFTAAAALVADGCGHSSTSGFASTVDAGDAQGSEADAPPPTESGGADADAAAQGDGFSVEASADGALECVLTNAGACETCTAANCCPQLLKCITELSDGGPTVCQSIQSCVFDCLNAGAITSTAAGCSLTCSQPFGTNPKVADWNTLLSCQQSFCFGMCY